MALQCNTERGEVPLTVGGVDLVIAAEMSGLAALSTRLGSPSFGEMYTKLAGAEINATIAAVECLAIQGDGVKAVKSMTLADLPKCTEAFMKALSHHAEKVVGNVEAAKTETTESLGGGGSESQRSD